ncbi:cytoskeleton adaptor for Rga7 GTPase activator Rng10 [Schizosaccharomyces osmophilus]|uniref:Cytoskeleton adaptor for Rga7 GTPase activator Rng10 n=1 Tax=Schizosaccharomyces osmophilus TaxID=2545709 RepID=A0AAE9WAN1_9SCHI|nr:cytoskeleton adaptor for Rga7 GTPase activator Rng10 [Schizosaccharomyces osmophilus]WBW72791.1 cytoskeleton adaptor for Rga7 GTPase activator Rng10 [Schizosaccharomyces osmophilus]
MTRNSMEEVKKKETANTGNGGLRRHISGRWISNVPSYEGNEWSSEESDPEENESNPTSADSLANLKSKEGTKHELEDQISEVSEEDEEEEEDDDSGDDTSDDDYGFDESSTFIYRKEASGSQETLATKHVTADESAKVWAEKRRLLLQRLGKNPDSKPADYTATYMSANVKQSASPLAENRMFGREAAAGPFTALNDAASATSHMSSQNQNGPFGDKSKDATNDAFEGDQTDKLSPSISQGTEKKLSSSFFHPPTENTTYKPVQDETVHHEQYFERPLDTTNSSQAESYFENPYSARSINQKQPIEQMKYSESKSTIAEKGGEDVSKDSESSDDTPSLALHHPESETPQYIQSESDDSFALPAMKVEENRNNKELDNDSGLENLEKPTIETSNPVLESPVPKTFEDKFFQKEDDLNVPLVESPEQSSMAFNEVAETSVGSNAEIISAPSSENDDASKDQDNGTHYPESPFLYSPHKYGEDRRFESDAASTSDYENSSHDAAASSGEEVMSTHSRILESSDDNSSVFTKDDAVDPPLNHPLYTLVGKTESNSNVFKSNAEKTVSDLKIHENGNLPLTEKKASVFNTGSLSETMSINSKASKLPDNESNENNESLENLYNYLSDETDRNVSKLNANDPFWSEGLQDDSQGVRATESTTSFHDHLPTIKEVDAGSAVPDSSNLIADKNNDKGDTLSLPNVSEGSRRTSINTEELEAAALTRGSLPSIPAKTNEKESVKPPESTPAVNPRNKTDQISKTPQLKKPESEKNSGKVTHDKSLLYFASLEAFVKSPLISIKEVNSLGSTDHRCNFFNRKIEELRNYDSGLDSWIASSQGNKEDVTSSKTFSKPVQMDYNKKYPARAASPAKSSGSIKHNIAAEARRKSKSAANDFLQIFKKKGKIDTDNTLKDSRDSKDIKGKKKLFAKKIGFKS